MLVEVHLCGGDPVRDVLWFGGRCLLCREFFVWKCLYVKMFLCGNVCVKMVVFGEASKWCYVCFLWWLCPCVNIYL